MNESRENCEAASPVAPPFDQVPTVSQLEVMGAVTEKKVESIGGETPPHFPGFAKPPAPLAGAGAVPLADVALATRVQQSLASVAVEASTVVAAAESSEKQRAAVGNGLLPSEIVAARPAKIITGAKNHVCSATTAKSNANHFSASGVRNNKAELAKIAGSKQEKKTRVKEGVKLVAGTKAAKNPRKWLPPLSKNGTSRPPTGYTPGVVKVKKVPLQKRSKNFKNLEAWNEYIRKKQDGGTISHGFHVPGAGGAAAPSSAANMGQLAQVNQFIQSLTGLAPTARPPAMLVAQMGQRREASASAYHPPAARSAPPVTGTSTGAAQWKQPPGSAPPKYFPQAPAAYPARIAAVGQSRDVGAGGNSNSNPAAALQQQATSWTAHDQAAANAAEHHLRWRLNAENQSRDGTSENDHGLSQELAQREQYYDRWLQQCAATLASQGAVTGAKTFAPNGELELLGSENDQGKAIPLPRNSHAMGGSANAAGGRTRGREARNEWLDRNQTEPNVHNAYTEIHRMAASSQAMANQEAGKKRSYSLQLDAMKEAGPDAQRRRSEPVASTKEQPPTHPNAAETPAVVGEIRALINHFSTAPTPAAFWPSSPVAAATAATTAGNMHHHQSMEEAVGRALVATASQNVPSPSNRAYAPRRVDTTMTYLVRQLLGQVEIVGDEPAVVLGPQLVKDASHKIRLVINKLVEIAVDTAKKESQALVQKVDARTDSNEESHSATSIELAEDMDVNDFITIEQQHRIIEALKQLAQDQVVRVEEQKITIDNLTQKLGDQIDLIYEQRSELESLRQFMRPSPKLQNDNATIRNLVKQLDGGISMVQRQKKEIEGLKTVVKEDADRLKEKDDMIEFLQEQLESQEPEIRQSQTLPENRRTLPLSVDTEPNSPKQVEIERLKKEVRDLEEALSRERRHGEQSLRAYMRAAVHALKVRSQNDNN